MQITVSKKIVRILFTKRDEFWQKSAVEWGELWQIKTKTKWREHSKFFNLYANIIFFLKETKIRKVQRLSDDRLEVPFIHCCLSCIVDTNAKVGTRLEHRHGHL